MVPVKCRVGVSEIATGQNENGAPLTLFDGVMYRPDLTADAISIAQNQVILNLHGNSLSVSGPTLLSTDESVTFTCNPVVVELLCTTLAEFPDFAANIAQLRAFEESLQDVTMALPSTTYSKDLQAHGQMTGLSSGFVLPVSYPSGVNARVGAIVLGSKLSVSPLRFSGHMYRFENSCLIEAGTILTRRVEWRKGEIYETRSCPVARIESITTSA